MTSSILIRLHGWRDVAVFGSPAWLAEIAPTVIRQLEAEIAASGIETEGQDATRLGAEHESPTGEAGDAQPPIHKKEDK